MYISVYISIYLSMCIYIYTLYTSITIYININKVYIYIYIYIIYIYNIYIYIYQMRTSNAILCISLFCHQQAPTVIFGLFWCTMPYTFQCIFLNFTLIVTFLNKSQWKAGVNQMILSYFRNGSSTCQLNIQAATTKNEK